MRASKQDQNYAWNRRAKPTSQKLAKEQQSNLGVVDLLGETQIITATTMEKKHRTCVNDEKNQASKKSKWENDSWNLNE